MLGSFLLIWRLLWIKGVDEMCESVSSHLFSKVGNRDSDGLYEQEDKSDTVVKVGEVERHLGDSEGVGREVVGSETLHYNSPLTVR